MNSATPSWDLIESEELATQRRELETDSVTESGTRAVASFASVDERTAFESLDLGDDRYDQTALLGRGGMGEVRLCLDRRLRRHVAMKSMRYDSAARSAERARFVREALSQAQLEHPSIVPLYDVGFDETGSLYFTMRRVQGLTLEEVLGRLREGDTDCAREYTRHRLLSAFMSVCLAVDYAHTRDVFHCDIKPTNIMLGSFGEVYVLDWGIAATGQANVTRTQASGTPGYMAPEQIKQLPIDARSDVYALGATLFEILTLAPLHEGNAVQALHSTLEGFREPPSARVPRTDIAPELDAICMRAVALDPDHRHHSARDLHDALARYMAGDRDLALRRQLSQTYTAAAAEAAARTRTLGHEAASDRSEALRAVGRALACDPENEAALRTLVELLTRPPDVMPKEAEEELFAAERAMQKARTRASAAAFFSWVVMLPLFYLWGAVSNAALAANLFAWLMMGGLSVYLNRRPRPDGRSPGWFPLIGGVAIAMTSLVTGPLLLTATFATTFAMGFTLAMRRRHRYVPMVTAVVAVSGAWLLHRTGIIASPIPALLDERTSLLVLVAELTMIIATSRFSIIISEKLASQQRRDHVTAWQLRQLLPKKAAASIE